MGQLPNHQATATELRQQGVVTGDAALARGVGDFHQRQFVAIRRGGTVHRELHVAAQHRYQRHFAVRDGLALLQRAVDHRFERARIAHQFRKEPSLGLGASYRQQRLRGVIQEMYGTDRIDDEYGCSERVEEV